MIKSILCARCYVVSREEDGSTKAMNGTVVENQNIKFWRRVIDPYGPNMILSIKDNASYGSGLHSKNQAFVWSIKIRV